MRKTWFSPKGWPLSTGESLIETTTLLLTCKTWPERDLPGLKHFLANFPKEFSIEGNKGCHLVCSVERYIYIYFGVTLMFVDVCWWQAVFSTSWACLFVPDYFKIWYIAGAETCKIGQQCPQGKWDSFFCVQPSSKSRTLTLVHPKLTFRWYQCSHHESYRS